MRSLDTDRALSSAYCVLAGLYPRIDVHAPSGGMSWQPVPVHTVALELDYVSATSQWRSRDSSVACKIITYLCLIYRFTVNCSQVHLHCLLGNLNIISKALLILQW